MNWSGAKTSTFGRPDDVIENVTVEVMEHSDSVVRIKVVKPQVRLNQLLKKLKTPKLVISPSLMISDIAALKSV